MTASKGPPRSSPNLDRSGNGQIPEAGYLRGGGIPPEGKPLRREKVGLQLWCGGEP